MVGKKKRRRKRKRNKFTQNKVSDEWSLYHINIRNLDARLASMESILAVNAFSVVTINETHFHAGRKVILSGYTSYSRNRVDKASGGITTSVLESDSPNCLRVEEGINQNEFLVTRHSQFETPINIINIYGQQECRLSKEEIDAHWNEVMVAVAKAEARKESILIVGDLNRAVGKIVPGNTAKESYGGKLLKNFVESNDYVLLNATDKVVNGPWTRVDPTNSETKSVLDMIIVSKDLEQYIDTLQIDSERRFTPFKQNKGKTLSFPDHFGLCLKFKRNPP